ncbi:MAG: 7-cyano-7-deazaguanine synthase [Candidatus Diapherotrites archaeon]|nr:7-cyano-7-deazaguanine synthase [Candidatus Diapherotrites archaeon]
MQKAKAKPKALLLLSGGIDSPVAGHIAMKSAEVVALHFASEKITGKESINKSIKLCRILRIKKLFIVDISDELIEIASKCKHAYYFVLMRRFMLRVAEEIAKKENCSFVVTGESIGQVSSQTLQNMSVISLAVMIPLVRPLLCMEKDEIVRIAHKIKTFEASKGPEYCDALGPKHPVTKASLEKVLEEEKKMPVQKMVENALAKCKKVLLAQYRQKT